jgi:hypothetical protein
MIDIFGHHLLRLAIVEGAVILIGLLLLLVLLVPTGCYLLVGEHSPWLAIALAVGVLALGFCIFGRGREPGQR